MSAMFARAAAAASSRRRHLGRRVNRAVGNTLFGLLIVAVMVPFLFPLYWMIASSFKVQAIISASPPVWIWQPTLQNYVGILTKVPFFSYAWNSLVIALSATVLSLLLGLPAAFSIARYRQYALASAILIVRILPGIAYIIPWYIIFSRAKLIGTYPTLILVHVMVTLPLTIWIMISFFEDLPSELTDAALIDGCSILGVFARVAVPLTLPGSMVAAIFSFNSSWNAFVSSALIGGIRIKTLPVIAYGMRAEYSLDWGGAMAAATVIVLPVIIFTLLVQKHIVRGLTFGALKG
ncbi:MAG: carbohydrate ABC transporter permease [Chloroflexi bacterium]|nr:carbohydrate ABC transporter permease [Chloroflexota bacterium]